MTSHHFSVRTIRASINPAGEKIVTLVARYPRFIHSELMTHKDLRRNASSSRAIPFKTMLRLTRKEMAAPIFWGKNQPGMQAQVELTGFAKWFAKFMWYGTGHIVLTLAWLLSFSKVHKQVINRMIEPWTYINVQITATNWNRMLNLRLDKAAQPEFQLLAQLIKEALDTAEYEQLQWGEWHLPWIDSEETMYITSQLILISSARSARLSYTPIGEPKRNIEKDLTLSNDLLVQEHLSPFEHPARAEPGVHAGMAGWCNYRTSIGM